MKPACVLLSALLPAALSLLGTASVAEAGLSCDDACTPDPNGDTCVEFNMGCNPFTHVCQACQDDTWCSPGGTCQANGQCANVNCGGQDGGTVDSGIDAGSSTTADAAQPPADAGFNPDATSNPDATLVDTGPRAGTTPYVRDDVYDEGCRCVAPTAGTHGAWALAGLLFAGSVALRRQTRRRA